MREVIAAVPVGLAMGAIVVMRRVERLTSLVELPAAFLAAVLIARRPPQNTLLHRRPRITGFR